ncbi:hypothetical protein SAMN04488503_2207 [Humidesulfovibrio mexicanus]|uniref:Uncharacterized protein n=1 Tax=Humidesulfovibrio mexicanus TaxID=147047 RepID=A0A239AUY2_9BACT|nr:hypothetical protein [Humidesulfovibrio mexicanus]SNR98844.1 hypothetical protein SAMN04488503_2207 [Humidesulfovibrio mexicanus]
MPSADITVCASQDCPRRLDCAVHSCHHTWADLAGAVRAGSNFDPYNPEQGGCEHFTEAAPLAMDARG